MKYFKRLFRAVIGKDLPAGILNIENRWPTEDRGSKIQRAARGIDIKNIRSRIGLAKEDPIDDDRTDIDAPIDYIITFFSATGGTIVRVSRPYSNNVVEDPTTSLYIVQDTSNLGEELSKIITMERMKR